MPESKSPERYLEVMDDLLFAYSSKDQDCPHESECEAVSQTADRLGNNDHPMWRIRRRGSGRSRGYRFVTIRTWPCSSASRSGCTSSRRSNCPRNFLARGAGVHRSSSPFVRRSHRASSGTHCTHQLLATGSSVRHANMEPVIESVALRPTPALHGQLSRPRRLHLGCQCGWSFALFMGLEVVRKGGRESAFGHLCAVRDVLPRRPR